MEVHTITNYRVLLSDKGLMFKEIDDVVVMNQHRVSQSNYMGTYFGIYANIDLECLKISDIRGYYRFHSIYSYHVYDLAYETNLILRRYLDSFDNLFYIGRPGRFEYTSQPRSIEMGTLAAQAIMNKEKT